MTDNQFDIQRQVERNVEKQVAKVFDDAREFNNILPILRDLSDARGWRLFKQDDKWGTISTKAEDRGVRGPTFDSLAELLKFVFA